MSWIHLQDWVAMVQWALVTTAISGPLNVTAPGPVTNEEFSRTLARALGRPSWLRAPASALRLVLGEMADALVLGGQRVLPEVARQHGFVFRYPRLESALKGIYS
jgi:NAD dependent epimerase/dehydratase family enzyme